MALARPPAAHTYGRARRGVNFVKAAMDLPDHAIEAHGLYKTYAATKTTPAKLALKEASFTRSGSCA